MPTVDRVYAVIRFEISSRSPLGPDEAEQQFTIMEVFADEESAEREVDRLNTLEGNDARRYSIQSARWYPLGRYVEG